MRILQVIPVFSARFGGPVRVVRSISKELAKRHEVTIYTTSALDHRHDFKAPPAEVKSDGYQVFYFPRILRFSGFNISPTMARAFQKTLIGYDVIHLHSWRHFQDMLTHYYAKLYDVPYVLQVHGSLPKRIAKQRLKWIYDLFFGYRLLRDVSKVIALSQMEAQQFRSIGVTKEKIEVIPNGIDLSEYGDLPPKRCFREEFALEESKKIILYLGRINKAKGIDFLVRAYAYLTKNMKCDGTILVVAGPDDGYSRELKELTEHLKIADKVTFTGMLSRKQKISAYVDSSIVVNVEPRNVFGLVPLEAAASFTPVIVSDGNAISDVVRQGKFGFSVRYGDIRELAETMDNVLNNDELSREMGRKGRKFVSERYDWTEIVTKLEKVYEETVK